MTIIALEDERHQRYMQDYKEKSKHIVLPLWSLFPLSCSLSLSHLFTSSFLFASGSLLLCLSLFQVFPQCCLTPGWAAWNLSSPWRQNASSIPSTLCLWWHCSPWQCLDGCIRFSQNHGTPSASAGTICLNLVSPCYHIITPLSLKQRFYQQFQKYDLSECIYTALISFSALAALL